jgi:putative transposase
MLDFKRRRFPQDIIMICVRWYIAYPLSYRDVEEMMGERGINLDY